MPHVHVCMANAACLCLQLGKEGRDAVLEVLADGKLKAAAGALPMLEQVCQLTKVSFTSGSLEVGGCGGRKALTAQLSMQQHSTRHSDPAINT